MQGGDAALAKDVPLPDPLLRIWKQARQLREFLFKERRNQVLRDEGTSSTGSSGDPVDSSSEGSEEPASAYARFAVPVLERAQLLLLFSVSPLPPNHLFSHP